MSFSFFFRQACGGCFSWLGSQQSDNGPRKEDVQAHFEEWQKPQEGAPDVPAEGDVTKYHANLSTNAGAQVEMGSPCGSYSNLYYKEGSISCEGGSNTMFKWTDEEGASWSLRFSRASNKQPSMLLTGDDCPHRGNHFELICADYGSFREVMGFSFKGEVYSRSAGGLDGIFIHVPEAGSYDPNACEISKRASLNTYGQNAWHRCTIADAGVVGRDEYSGYETQRYKWTNEVGASWFLTAHDEEHGGSDYYVAGSDCPFSDKELSLDYRKDIGGDAVLAGFIFMDRYYEKVQHWRQEGCYGRVPAVGHAGTLKKGDRVAYVGEEPISLPQEFATYVGCMFEKGDISTEVMTIDEAEKHCMTNLGSSCEGFCYRGRPYPEGPVEVFFKKKRSEKKWFNNDLDKAWNSCCVVPKYEECFVESVSKNMITITTPNSYDPDGPSDPTVAVPRSSVKPLARPHPCGPAYRASMAMHDDEVYAYFIT